MKLGKLVAKGVAEDVLDSTVEAPRPAREPGQRTIEVAAAPPSTVEPLTAGPVTAGSSTPR